MNVYQHVLLATAFSPVTTRLLNKGIQIGRQFHARLSVLHVLEKHPLPLYRWLELIDIEGKITAEAESQLRRVTHAFHVPAEDLLVAVGNPGKQILEKAEELGIDLIIIGKHNHRQAKLIGHTADQIAHHVACDVMMLH